MAPGLRRHSPHQIAYAEHLRYISLIHQKEEVIMVFSQFMSKFLHRVVDQLCDIKGYQTLTRTERAYSNLLRFVVSYKLTDDEVCF